MVAPPGWGPAVAIPIAVPAWSRSWAIVSTPAVRSTWTVPASSLNGSVT